MRNKELSTAFLELVGIMDELRNKCPWDKKQTIQSLRPLSIEEIYELAAAITEHDWDGIREELGDLLLHVLFYSKIGSEERKFTLEEVIRGISKKLISRHPHIYGDVKADNEEEVKKNWEKLKLLEGKKTVLGGVPASLPATIKAMRLQEKARQVGFEWENKNQVWEKVQEEIGEFQEAVQKEDKAKIEEEFGDVIFSLINYARFLQIDAENALEVTNKKFISRFNKLEQEAIRGGKRLEDMTLEEMDQIWNRIKNPENRFE